MNDLLRLTPSDIQIRGMAHPHSLRHPLFRRRWFADDVIITCVRWYLRFKLSYPSEATLPMEPLVRCLEPPAACRAGVARIGLDDLG